MSLFEMTYFVSRGLNNLNSIDETFCTENVSTRTAKTFAILILS